MGSIQATSRLDWENKSTLSGQLRPFNRHGHGHRRRQGRHMMAITEPFSLRFEEHGGTSSRVATRRDLTRSLETCGNLKLKTRVAPEPPYGVVEEY